jgi:hypothetical protein
MAGTRRTRRRPPSHQPCTIAKGHEAVSGRRNNVGLSVFPHADASFQH